MDTRIGDRTVNPRLLIAHSPYWSREAPRPIQAPSLAAAIASSVPVCDGAGCEADLPNPIQELERPTLGRRCHEGQPTAHGSALAAPVPR